MRGELNGSKERRQFPLNHSADKQLVAYTRRLLRAAVFYFPGATENLTCLKGTWLDIVRRGFLFGACPCVIREILGERRRFQLPTRCPSLFECEGRRTNYGKTSAKSEGRRLTDIFPARLRVSARSWVGNAISILVDPASSHMLVSKIKPCTSKYKPH